MSTRITGAVGGRQKVPDQRQLRSGQRGSQALFRLGGTVTGAASLELVADFTTGAAAGATVTHYGQITMPLALGIATYAAGTADQISDYPEVILQVAFPSQPLDASPAWQELSTRLRGESTNRGRSYEFERMETGTLSALLSNRDSALSPINTASPYDPIRSTRPLRALLVWDGTYPLFRGITEGFPQNYPGYGFDAVVAIQANDLFYALNNAGFTPGTTTLAAAMLGGVTGIEEVVHVASTATPLPEVVPFAITVAGLTSEWPTEEMQVVEVLSPTQWRVLRSDQTLYEHPAGAAVTTDTVSFGEEMSGSRIRRVLEAVGFDANWYDLDSGQSLIAPSEDLAAVSPLEHINLIADAEFGRFFVSRAGKFTFRDRQLGYVDNLTPVMTFGITPGTVPYTLQGSLEHDESKLYNRVKITIQGGDYDGEIVDVADQASIDEHFERVFERTFPYAIRNDADSAAQWVLSHHAEARLRLPAVTVYGAIDPATLWPLLLAREIGERCRFRYQPQGGGDEIDIPVVTEGISHQIADKNHAVSFQLSEVDDLNYWILGRAGYTELGSTTRVGF